MSASWLDEFSQLGLPGGTPADRRGPGALEGGVTTFSCILHFFYRKFFIFVYSFSTVVALGKKRPWIYVQGFLYLYSMAYIEHNFFPLKVYVRNEYMYQGKKGHGEFTPGVIISVRCMPGQAALFQVLLENGVLRDKLPSHALLTEPKLPEPDLPFHYLQIWNCFSYNFTLLHLSYLYDAPVEVYMKDKKFYRGSYYATINWGSNDPNTDLSLAEDPLEHKSHHIILLDNGQIALQPNNRIKWSEPSFVTKPFPERPDYLVNKDYYNCEGYEKWHTEDSDRMFYDNE